MARKQQHEEDVKAIPKTRISDVVVQQFVDLPVLEALEKVFEVTQSVPQEGALQRTVERFVDVPATEVGHETDVPGVVENIGPDLFIGSTSIVDISGLHFNRKGAGSIDDETVVPNVVQATNWSRAASKGLPGFCKHFISSSNGGASK